MKNFKNKKIFITGGSSGIGLSIAELFSSMGADVMIFARTKDRLKQALEKIEMKRVSDKQRFSFMAMDVSDNKNVEKTFSNAVKDFGIPDVLINNAGRAYPNYFEEITYSQFEETLKINLHGIWNTIATILPHMKEKGGYIVNVSSIAGFIGVFGYSDYSASKYAIIGLSEVLASEFKRYNISVSVLCPPDTDTPGFHEENKTKPEETKAISAKAGIMNSEKVAMSLVKGMRKKRFIIIPGLDGKFTYLAKRLFPKLVRHIIERTIRNANKSVNK